MSRLLYTTRVNIVWSRTASVGTQLTLNSINSRTDPFFSLILPITLTLSGKYYLNILCLYFTCSVILLYTKEDILKKCVYDESQFKQNQNTLTLKKEKEKKEHFLEIFSSVFHSILKHLLFVYLYLNFSVSFSCLVFYILVCLFSFN